MSTYDNIRTALVVTALELAEGDKQAAARLLGFGCRQSIYDHLRKAEANGIKANPLLKKVILGCRG